LQQVFAKLESNRPKAEQLSENGIFPLKSNIRKAIIILGLFTPAAFENQGVAQQYARELFS